MTLYLGPLQWYNNAGIKRGMGVLSDDDLSIRLFALKIFDQYHCPA
jgi:hypothetical protein